MRVIDALLEHLVDEYAWIHTSIGLLGNICFIIGSVLFMSPPLKQVGIWFFLAGSTGMLIGNLGNALVMELERRWRRQHEREQARQQRADRQAS